MPGAFYESCCFARQAVIPSVTTQPARGDAARADALIKGTREGRVTHARAASSHLPQGDPGWPAPPSQGIWVG